MYRLKPHIGHVSYTLPTIKPRPCPSESLGTTVLHLSLPNTSTRIRLLLRWSYGLITQQHWLGTPTARWDSHMLTHFQDQPAALLLLPTGGWRSYPQDHRTLWTLPHICQRHRWCRWWTEEHTTYLPTYVPHWTIILVKYSSGQSGCTNCNTSHTLIKWKHCNYTKLLEEMDDQITKDDTT